MSVSTMKPLDLQVGASFVSRLAQLRKLPRTFATERVCHLQADQHLEISQNDPEQAAAIASEVEAAVIKNLNAIRAMFLETPRAY